MMRRFIELNRRVSHWERSAIARFTSDGMRGGGDFSQRLLPTLLRPGLRVLDVGGGKRPAIEPEVKRSLGLTVTGLDVSDQELLAAPPGAYDDRIVGDVSTTTIRDEYQLILSRNVLEHVTNTGAALCNMARSLVRGGTMAHLIPCRNAPYAVLNRLIGNRLSRVLLFSLFPAQRDKSGFPAHYRECTPRAITRLCSDLGLTVIDLVPYYRSEYASFFVPLYTLELSRQFVADRLALENFCESFSVVARSES